MEGYDQGRQYVLEQHILQGWEGVEGCILERMVVLHHTIFDMLGTRMPWLGDKKMETSPYEGCETRKDFLIK